jgi:ubiquinone/menaquinone biosynthesis C-methylase UbiE
MTTIAERYDRLAERYERWWAPVLAPTARGLATALAPFIAERPATRILDVGTGTGTVAIELVQRFSGVHVTGVDASGGMLDQARDLAQRRLGRDAVERLKFARGEAAELPFEAQSFDAVVSSFVFQLVPDRFAALREARRILRPDGLLAVLTWLGYEESFEPDEALEDAIDELQLDLDEEPDDCRSGNYASAQAAAAQARRAGFRDVRATTAELVHRYDPARYLEFLEEYAERGLFEGLRRADRARLRDATRRRLARLRAEDFVWRMRVVTVTGRRNG